MRIIHKTPAGYEIEYFDAEGREIRDLFGTTVLPLPFTAATDPTTVLADQKSRTSQPVYICDCVGITPEQIRCLQELRS